MTSAELSKSVANFVHVCLLFELSHPLHHALRSKDMVKRMREFEEQARVDEQKALKYVRRLSWQRIPCSDF